MKMNSYISAYVVLISTLLSLSNAVPCEIKLRNNSKCQSYNAAAKENESCLINNISELFDLYLKRANNVPDVFIRFKEVKLRNDENMTKWNDTKISESITEDWIRIQSLRINDVEPVIITIGNEIINVPDGFKPQIWLKGAILFTNGSDCLDNATITEGYLGQWWLYVIIGILAILASVFGIVVMKRYSIMMVNRLYA